MAPKSKICYISHGFPNTYYEGLDQLNEEWNTGNRTVKFKYKKSDKIQVAKITRVVFRKRETRTNYVTWKTQRGRLHVIFATILFVRDRVPKRRGAPVWKKSWIFANAKDADRSDELVAPILRNLAVHRLRGPRHTARVPMWRILFRTMVGTDRS